MKKASSYPLTTQKLLKRLIFTFFIETLSLLVITLIVPGVTIDDKPLIEAVYTIILAALVLGILNLLVRPFLIRITVSINTLIFGVSILLINALMLAITSYLVPGFIVKDIVSALLGALVLAGANTIFIRLVHLNEDSSFFATVLLRLIKKQQEMPDSREPGHRGLVILEIDGLSYERMKRAAEVGIMRTVNEMLKNGTHKLSLLDCGLPSQTSACQAGILYGNNYDIPGFRWFDKNQGKMIVSNNFGDAAQLNARLGQANNNALLKDGGSSIVNMFDGGASKTLFTLCAISGKKKNQDVMKRHRRQQQQDLYLVYLHPYFFTSTITMTLWDIIVELCQGLRQIICNTQPRINRLKKGYPFVRALMNVLLRNLSTYLVCIDVLRGVPIVYTTYVGYDEVAHYAGPDTSDAMNTLRTIDKQILFLRDIVNQYAPRPYDIFILSDHGQSFGATFKQRYKQSISQLIKKSLTKLETHIEEPQFVMVGESYKAALAAEFESANEPVPSVGPIRRAALNLTRQTLDRNNKSKVAAASSTTNADVIICPSGNLANIYFRLNNGKITIDELNASYPGLVKSLLAHPGIGFIVAYKTSENPIVIGKLGTRDLIYGNVVGDDPLREYGHPELRAAQLLRLAQFPHAGDLILNSTLYLDGQVAAFEELVGSHGGLGGQQTCAFLLHPYDIEVPPQISNSLEIFDILNAQRDNVFK
jgi:uncharacterized membrane protein YvlD (DUF360 family)